MTNKRLSVVPGVATSEFDNAGDTFANLELIDNKDPANDKPENVPVKRKPVRKSKAPTEPKLREDLTKGIDLADPAQTALILARYNSLNDALKQMAIETDSQQQQNVELLAENGVLSATVNDQAVQIKHLTEKLDLLKESIGFGRQIKEITFFGLKVGVAAFAAFAAFAVIFL